MTFPTVPTDDLAAAPRDPKSPEPPLPDGAYLIITAVTALLAILLSVLLMFTPDRFADDHFLDMVILNGVQWVAVSILVASGIRAPSPLPSPVPPGEVESPREK